jgi:glyoxylate carboligase
MSQKVADLLWEMLANAGVKRCYGIVGDALNPVIDALRRNGRIELIHVRHAPVSSLACTRPRRSRRIISSIRKQSTSCHAARSSSTPLVVGW